MAMFCKPFVFWLFLLPCQDELQERNFPDWLAEPKLDKLCQSSAEEEQEKDYFYLYIFWYGDILPLIFLPHLFWKQSSSPSILPSLLMFLKVTQTAQVQPDHACFVRLKPQGVSKARQLYFLIYVSYSFSSLFWETLIWKGCQTRQHNTLKNSLSRLNLNGKN